MRIITLKMEEEIKQNTWTKFKGFVKECRRVIKVTKKPSGEEFKTIVKVSGLGMIVIGLVGFIIQMFKILIFN